MKFEIACQRSKDELRVAQNDLAETRDGLQSAQYELQMVRDELITSRSLKRSYVRPLAN